jgi:tetratricopeptide (TPR) repeat protein
MSGIKELNSAAAIEPHKPYIYVWRSYFYQRVEKHEEAIADYTKLINFRDTKFFANKYYFNRAHSLRELGRYEEALADYKKALEFEKGSKTYIYFDIGATYSKMNDHKTAIGFYDKVIEQDPLYRDAYYNRWFAYWTFDDFVYAAADFAKAAELDPKHTNSYLNLSGVYHQSGDNKKASINAKKACELGDYRTVEFLKNVIFLWSK